MMATHAVTRPVRIYAKILKQERRRALLIMIWEKLLEIYKGRPMQELKISRKQLFEDVEKKALTAAETGHLVFATLHTMSAAETVNRIVDVFPAEQQGQIRAMFANAVQGIVAQRLLPTKDGNGRVAAHEIMIATAAVRNLIREEKTHQIFSAIQTGGAYGMQTMDQALKTFLERGRISREEALANATDPKIFG